jgi:hypothetical protein
MSPVIRSHFAIQPPTCALATDGEIVVAGRIDAGPPSGFDTLRTSEDLRRSINRRRFEQPQWPIGKRDVRHWVGGVALHASRGALGDDHRAGRAAGRPVACSCSITPASSASRASGRGAASASIASRVSAGGASEGPAKRAAASSWRNADRGGVVEGGDAVLDT